MMFHSMAQSQSTRSSQASLPALKQNQIHSNQLMHQSMGQGKFAIDDVITSQGSIKRDVMRNSESVQAVRQESIMLAEKVQHATNLYRQLAARVGKTEERFEMEQKTMGNILGQAKQIEMQLIQQQEQLVSKDGQLALQVHKLQEEVIMLKNEREQYRKQMQSIQQEVRTIADKITRQSGALSNGLQDLKSYLDQKDMEKNQELTTTFSTMQTKLDAIEHRTTISLAQTEGRCEKLNLQIAQNEKQRQEDVYQVSTSIREKEAICKADLRRLDEKVKNMFEDIAKGVRSSEGKLKSDFDVKYIELERKMTFDQKDSYRKISELEDEIHTKMSELTESNREEMQSFATHVQEQLESNQGIDELRKEVKHIDKSLRNHKKDIEKVVRAEISSRVTQGERLTTVLGELKKDHMESFAFLESTFGDHKRKHDESIEFAKKDLTRYTNETIKANKCTYDEARIIDMEKKLDEMEDGLEELAKQEERIGLNSEQLKQVEMENILAQGDMNASIDVNAKEISTLKSKVDETKKSLKALAEKKPRPPSALQKLEEQTIDLNKSYQILPSQIKLVEKKLMFLAEAFETYKVESRNTVPSRKGTPVARPTSDDSNEKISMAVEKVSTILSLIKDVLQLNLIDSDPEQEMSKNKELLQELKEELEDLADMKTDSDDEEEDNEEEDDNENETKDDKDESDNEKDEDENEEDDDDGSEDDEEDKKKSKDKKKKEKDKKQDDDSNEEEDEDENDSQSDDDKEKPDKEDEKKDEGKDTTSEDESEEEAEDDDWSDDDEEEAEDDEEKEGDDGDEDEQPVAENSDDKKEKPDKKTDKNNNEVKKEGSAKKRDKKKRKEKGTK